MALQPSQRRTWKVRQKGVFSSSTKEENLLTTTGVPWKGEEVALRVTWGVAEGSLPVVGGWTTPMTLNPGGTLEPWGVELFLKSHFFLILAPPEVVVQPI